MLHCSIIKASIVKFMSSILILLIERDELKELKSKSHKLINSSVADEEDTTTEKSAIVSVDEFFLLVYLICSLS